MKHLIRKILKEESLSKSLINQLEENGWRETAELVGGPENLVSILGKSKENVIKMLISNFHDLHLEKRGGSLELFDVGIPLIEKTNFNFQEYGSSTIVYDFYIRSRFDLELRPLYNEFRRDLIVELISRYPELYSKEIEVFDDAGRHIKVDEFEL